MLRALAEYRGDEAAMAALTNLLDPEAYSLGWFFIPSEDHCISEHAFDRWHSRATMHYEHFRLLDSGD